MDTIAKSLLRQLEKHCVAPTGERVVDVERATTPGHESPEPVLLLTDAALYANRADGHSWARLPLDRVAGVSVSTDPSGMLTRYRVMDASGHLWFDLALPMARSSFRARMEELQSRRAGAPTAMTSRVLPTRTATTLASLASARAMAAAASMVSAASAASVTPVRSIRVA